MSSQVRSERQDMRRSTYKKTFSADENRRKREEHQVEIRRARREDSLMKKRRERLATAPSSDASAAAPLDPALLAAASSSAGPAPANAAAIAQLPALCADLMMAQDLGECLRCTTEIRKMLSIERNPPIETVVQNGVVPRFVEFLQATGHPALQFEAAWALTNIASGTSAHTNAVINAGAVPILIGLLSSPDEDVREQSVWALGNIAGDSTECRDLVLSHQALRQVLTLLISNSRSSLLRNATWTLSNLCRGKPPPAFETVRDSIPVLARLLANQDEDILIDACWALSFLSDGVNPKIQAVIDSGVVPRLVELLGSSLMGLQTPALRTVGNIVTGDDAQTQAVLDSGALPLLLQLMQSQKKSIRKEACWTISNITAGTKSQIQQVIEGDVFPSMLHLLMNAEFDIKKEAAWAVSNATSGGTPGQIDVLVKLGCIFPLCELLSVQDSKVVTVALEGIENILKAGRNPNSPEDNMYAEGVESCGGLDKLESLQHHSNTDIYNKAVRILEEYFQADQDDIAELAPEMDDNQFTFGNHQNAPEGGFNFGNGSMS